MMTSSEGQLLADVLSNIVDCEKSQPAVVEGDRAIRYGELNSRANRVAHYLREQGAGAEWKIGIAMGRSIEFVVAALGVLKSGAAYVPLDPGYPEAKRKSIAEDAGLRVILTSGNTEALTATAKSVALDDAEIGEQPDTEPALAAADPQQLAYVIYTSGSTGASKGVEVTRANLRHLVEWHNARFGVTAEDRATLIANVGFDAAVWEMWPYLAAGATLHIPSPELIRDPEALQEWVASHGITVMFAPTLLAEVLIALDWTPDASLRTLLTGGDALRSWPRADLPFRLVNNYGPAECTVVSTSGEVPAGDAGQKPPSIGKAIAGARVFLLDDSLNEVPTGSSGEICIAGNGVARGYLNQPELTAQRFVTLPDGTRVYRSGDLGRLNGDGSIQFLGRMDEQVKVRGYRIECGEIEAALTSLDEVRTCAVVLREQRGGHKGLTAFVVPQPGAELSRDALREGLRSLLAEYMIPEQFVRIDALPISENGKIDRRKLPEVTDATIIRSHEAPATPVEMELMEILTKLLKIDQIERRDDFFLMGGHSFAAAQLIARIRNHFGVELSLRAVFENPTPAGMAQQIEQRRAAKA